MNDKGKRNVCQLGPVWECLWPSLCLRSSKYLIIQIRTRVVQRVPVSPGLSQRMANVSYDVGVHEIYQTCFSHLKSRWGLHDAKCVLSQHPVRGRITVLKGEARSQIDGAFFFFKISYFFFTCRPFFKVFIEFVTALLLFYFILFFWPWGVWNLSSLSGDQCTERQSLNHWTTREVLWCCFEARYCSITLNNIHTFPHLHFFLLLVVDNSRIMVKGKHL